MEGNGYGSASLSWPCSDHPCPSCCVILISATQTDLHCLSSYLRLFTYHDIKLLSCSCMGTIRGKIICCTLATLKAYFTPENYHLK